MNKLFSLVVLLLIYTPLMAAEFCVNSSSSLQNALSVADSNAQDDHIKIKRGTYQAPLGGFVYSGHFEPHNIKISGGWQDFFGGSCSLNVFTSAFDTVLDGDFTERVLRLDPATSSQIDVEITGLTFVSGVATTSTNQGGGLMIFGLEGANTGHTLLEGNAFINNSANKGSGLLLRGQHMVIRNNVFAVNHSTQEAAVHIVTTVNNNSSLIFTNNTVVNNLISGPNPLPDKSAGFLASVNPETEVLIANNIYWNNQINDYKFLGGGTAVYFYNNDVGNISETSWSHQFETNNMSLPPKFKTGLLEYTPSLTSPLINQGFEPLPLPIIGMPFLSSWVLGSSDAEGRTRVNGGRVDIGAVEALVDIFRNGFD